MPMRLSATAGSQKSLFNPDLIYIQTYHNISNFEEKKHRIDGVCLNPILGIWGYFVRLSDQDIGQFTIWPWNILYSTDITFFLFQILKHFYLLINAEICQSDVDFLHLQISNNCFKYNFSPPPLSLSSSTPSLKGKVSTSGRTARHQYLLCFKRRLSMFSRPTKAKVNVINLPRIFLILMIFSIHKSKSQRLKSLWRLITSSYFQRVLASDLISLWPRGQDTSNLW